MLGFVEPLNPYSYAKGNELFIRLQLDPIVERSENRIRNSKLRLIA